MKPSATWELGWTYVAISRLPQLTALAAWGTDGTWTRGIHFVDDASVCEVSEPEHGSLPLDLGAGIEVTRAASYAVERRRGWVEAPGSPVRAEEDPWDQRRAHELRMQKEWPGGGVRLEVHGGYAALRTKVFSSEITYRVGDVELPGVQWADCSRDGRLLVATVDGRLETRAEDDWTRAATVVADLSLEHPLRGAASVE
jgi:hypothetical protein